MAKRSKQNLSDSQIKKNKTDKIMNIVAERASYYRANPHRFVKDYLGIELKLFQKILLFCMMHNDAFYYIASRGQGKTYLVSLFCVVRCLLYPGTTIVVSSYTFKQGKETIMKITDDFMRKSPLLRSEIAKYSIGQNDCSVYFKSGGWIQVKVAAESSRGAHCQILIIDESRMVQQKIIDTVLKPMLSAPRTPPYINKPEYKGKGYEEMNKILMMSSAWYKQSEMYEIVKAYVANMLDPKMKYFICDLPYTLSIAEHLLMRQSIENEMSEATFSDISFKMEREGIFYGSGDESLFNFNVLNTRRILQDSFHDLDFYRNSNVRIPQKQAGEKRILSLDIALLASKKHDNDASAFIINSALPTSSNDYISNIKYIETQEGLMTEELGLMTMRYFYQYDCDYIAIDANGVGQGVLDYLMQDRYDSVYNMTYGALNCCNNDDLADRCKVRNAPKVIYAIKASAKSNNDMCLALRSGFQNGNINLLNSETEIDEKLQKLIKGFNKLSDTQKIKLRLPYYQTTFLIEELINLDHEVNNGLIKVKEKSGMRKDRYSSLEYNYYVVQELALKLKPKNTNMKNLADILPIRTAKRHSYFD